MSFPLYKPKMAKPLQNKTRPRWEQVSADNLCPGDHVRWMEWSEDKSIVMSPYSRHAIVLVCDHNTLSLICWRFHSDKNKKTPDPKIVQEEIKKSQGMQFHRAVYAGTCHSAEETVRRALKLLDDQPKYHIVTNYARALPRYCKTGYGGLTFSL